jgi:antitoxin component YwqK of YwqJK toxin-antitoxin module
MTKLRIPFDQLSYDMRGFYTWEGNAFTGTSYELYPDGQLWDESEFVDGVQEGTSRVWYSSGQLKHEDILYFDPPEGPQKGSNGHFGTKREWFENGQLKREIMVKASRRVGEKEWDEAGNLIHEYEKD